MQRRTFLRRSGVLLGAAPAAGVLGYHPPSEVQSARDADRRGYDPTDWEDVRDQFALRRDRIHMASFLIASHPRPVAEAIRRHRAAFDEDPATYWEENVQQAEPSVRRAAAEYLATDPGLIALTDSTTMGLGLVYGGLRLGADQEVLTTPHGHYATLESLRLRAERTGAVVREVALYDDAARASVDEVVTRMRDAISDRTRVLAVTWVHSSTGVKLPLAAMAEALDEINAGRDEGDRVLFCVDGVHGLGIEDVTMDELGCDFFIAGTHKWLHGPRGTGLIWGREHAWDALEPIIPTFGPTAGVWIGALPPDTPLITHGTYHTPGGFHSFEHRWALGEAFRFHREIGKSRIRERVHSLNSLAKQALADMPHVRIHTPMSPELSAGIICFEVDGHTPTEVVEGLREDGIVASTSPYPVSYVRLAPSIINDEEEVHRSVDAVAAMA